MEAVHYPFPGMDPYLEHPQLWPGVHLQLMVAIANQLQPRIDPRYVASLEKRVFIEGPQQASIPHVLLKKTRDHRGGVAVTAPAVATPLVFDVGEVEVHERRVEILDLYQGQRLVTLIEVVNPANKKRGPGRRSYREKQREVLARDCHLVEIDLLRRGRHVLSVPESVVEDLRPLQALVCVNRWPKRNRFEVYHGSLRERLPGINIPLANPDPDTVLDIQAALEKVYWDGRYMRRVRYDEPCVPRLKPADQRWADERWAEFRAARADLFPDQES